MQPRNLHTLAAWPAHLLQRCAGLLQQLAGGGGATRLGDALQGGKGGPSPAAGDPFGFGAAMASVAAATPPGISLVPPQLSSIPVAGTPRGYTPSADTPRVATGPGTAPHDKRHQRHRQPPHTAVRQAHEIPGRGGLTLDWLARTWRAMQGSGVPPSLTTLALMLRCLTPATGGSPAAAAYLLHMGQADGVALGPAVQLALAQSATNMRVSL